MMWLKYAGTIETIIALSCVYEKVSPLGKPQLQYREIDEMLYLVGGGRKERGRGKEKYRIFNSTGKKM